MFRASNIITLAAWLLLLPQPSLATGAKRQATASSIAPDIPKTTLQPVLPPDNDPEDFSVLSPDTSLNLYYGGVPNSSLTKRADDNSGILVNLDFTFLHPSVPLDYSSFISGVSCSDNNTLAGVFSTANAYAYGKQAWSGLDNILLISSADGCGADNQNDVFLANSISFSDSDLSFTATGQEYMVKDVAEKSDITWGNVTPKKLRKRAYGGGAAQYSDIAKRLCIFQCDYSQGFDVSLGFMLADQDGMSVDTDAPWENAVLLESFGPDADENGGSEGGDSKRRRSASTTELTERDGLEYGLKLYCVDCGFQGTASATGSLGINFVEAECYNAQVTLSGNLYAGMFLGLEMFVEYSKTYEKDFARVYLNPWDIPGIFEFGPYVSVGIEASIDIKAQGTLLVGASATWDAFNAVMDFLNPDSSSATGFDDPTIVRKAEAEVDLTAEATLGLPLSFGVGVTIVDIWSVDVALTDTPAIVADAEFKASANLDSCEGSQCDNNSSGDGSDCEGGIEWSVGFQNTLAFTVTDFDPYVIDLYKPDPIADGCINILGSNNGTTNGTDDGSGNGSGDGSGNGDGNGSTCTPGTVVATNDASATCGQRGAMLLDHAPAIGPLKKGYTVPQCAARCLNHNGCEAFAFNTAQNTCRMYSMPVSGLQIKPTKKNPRGYYDAGCYAITTCTS